MFHMRGIFFGKQYNITVVVNLEFTGAYGRCLCIGPRIWCYAPVCNYSGISTCHGYSGISTCHGYSGISTCHGYSGIYTCHGYGGIS
ncbi:hypothetical protein ROHU_001721 [Labeo rohita]|uniref:Uncharacterized protein n=1 Tax=Labeo rohita TaxID=84645 RepID=A0A498P0T5_LABRO|nr:hypothetical protein ROHU_001721 [Labeo rohita]